MPFASANPSVVRSVVQRDLLNGWLRGRGKPGVLPAIQDYRPEAMAGELAEMMRFDVIGEVGNARFLITQEGSRLAAAYGNQHIDPDQRTNRFLDDAIGPALYARVVPFYRACLARKRPIYSISMVPDPHGKEVCYERLLLPFGGAGHVTQILGSYKAISIEGRFEITNLMGIRSSATPVTVVEAVIDLDFVPAASAMSARDDVIELS